MFADLAKLVSVFISSAASLASLKEKRQTETALINLLTIHVLLTQVLDHGRELLSLAGVDPLETLRLAPIGKVEDLEKAFKAGVALQGQRLYWLAGQLRGDLLLEYVDPAAKKRLEEIIGSKFDRVNTLAGTVSGLVMSTMFGCIGTHDEMSSLVRSMYLNSEHRPLSVAEARAELDGLARELAKLRAACDRCIPDRDLPRLLAKVHERLSGKAEAN